MAQDLQVKITTGAGDAVTFDLEGRWSWSQEPVYRDNANPPTLSEIRERWRIEGALLRSSDGSSATGWDEFLAAKAKWERSGSQAPTKLEVIRDPSAAAPVTELTLGPPTYQEFRIESVEGSPSDLAPSASFRTLFPVSLVVSAVRVYADTTGIVNWEQEVAASYTNGLKTLEWVTTISTAEGVNALEKAEAYAVIPIASVGSSYAYQTNSDSGIEYAILDADEQSGRTPTRVRARSAIRQFAVNVGATSAGTSPDVVFLEDTETTTQGEKRKTRTARAEGPGAKIWARAQKPTWASDEELRHDKSNRIYQATWSTTETDTGGGGREEEAGGGGAVWLIRGDVTGGHQAISFEAVSGGLAPVEFRGPLMPWTLTVSIQAERVGGTGKASELKFPPVLPGPWILDLNASSETDPYITTRGATPEQDRYRRDARLVYRCATKPKSFPVASIREQKKAAVESYFYG